MVKLGLHGDWKPTVAVVLAACVVPNIWFRGPFFGLVFLAFVAPPALLITVILRYARVPQKVVLPVGVIAGILASWAVCAPMTTSQLFERCLHCPMPDNVRDLKRWDDCWGIDSLHYLRFYATKDAVETILAGGVLYAEASPPERTDRGLFLLPVRDWWKPAEMNEPQVWRGRWYDWHAEMWYEVDSGLVYLWVYAM